MGSVDMGNWGKDKWVVGLDRSKCMLLDVGYASREGKEEGSKLLGSEEWVSIWDKSESCSETVDNGLGESGSEILLVDVQNSLLVEQIERSCDADTDCISDTFINRSVS